MSIGALGNTPVAAQTGIDGENKKIDFISEVKIKILYGDASKTSMLSAHMGWMENFYRNVKDLVGSTQNNIP